MPAFIHIGTALRCAGQASPPPSQGMHSSSQDARHFLRWTEPSSTTYYYRIVARELPGANLPRASVTGLSPHSPASAAPSTVS